MMKFRKSILVLTTTLMVILMAGASFAWSITEELKQELAQKKASVEANPNSPNAHFDLAITYAYTNHIEEGLNELKKVEELDKDYAPVALEYYSKEAEARPDDWKIKFRLGFAYYFNKDKVTAIEVMKEVAEMEPKDDPKRIWAYGYISLLYGELDQVDEAIEWVKKAISIDSNVAAFHLLLAAGYSKKGWGWNAFLEGMEALRLRALGF